jgi:hypothetical protein
LAPEGSISAATVGTSRLWMGMVEKVIVATGAAPSDGMRRLTARGEEMVD